MTDLILQGNTQALTMSSREIADLTGKQHKHVIRDIRSMLDALGDGPDLGHVREDRDARGYTTGFHLDKELTETLVTGYSIPLRHKVIKRLHELEQQNAAGALPQTLPEALRLAADMAERNAQLEVVASEQAETIENLQNLFVEGMTPAQFVKGLNGVNCMAINQLLAERNWLFREGGHWRVGGYARDKYLTEQQAQITPRNAEPFVQFKPILLRKGAAAIYKLYLKRKLVMKSTWNGEFTHDSIKKVA